MQRARVTLRQAQLDRLVKGETVIVRLRETELEIHLDSLAKIGTGFDQMLESLGLGKKH